MLSEAPVASATPSEARVALFDRLPERLVLEGFRRWMAGYATGDLAPLGGGVEPARRLARVARTRVTSSIAWRASSERCATGRSVRSPASPAAAATSAGTNASRWRIVAASQNQDLDCLSAAMRHLLDPDGHEEAMLPALAYAEAMRDSEMMLMPVPRCVIDEIAGRPLDARLH